MGAPAPLVIQSLLTNMIDMFYTYFREHSSDYTKVHVLPFLNQLSPFNGNYILYTGRKKKNNSEDIYIRHLKGRNSRPFTSY